MDRAEWLIRAAKPEIPSELSERAEQDLARILATGGETPGHNLVEHPPTARRHGNRVWLAAAAVLVAILAVPIWMLTGTHAHAATPPLLKVEPVGGTTEETLHRLAEVARTSPAAPPSGSIQISVEAWTLTTEDDGVARESTVLPQRIAITREPDGALTKHVTAGAPLGSINQETPTEGELLWEQTWPPEDASYLFATPAPSDPQAVAEFLAAPRGEAPPLSASASIDELGSLLLEQELSPAQTGAVLDYLATLPDLTVAGATTDRLGRSGLLFSATRSDDSERAEHIVIAEETGRILAIEGTYQGSSRTDIPSPSVVHYYAWR